MHASTNRTAVHRRVEEDAQRAERLAAPLRPEAEEDNVPAIDLDVERRSLAVQVLLADQIAREKR